MKKILIATALCILAGTAGAQAKSTSSNFYGELGYQHLKLDFDSAPGFSPTPAVGSGILGYQFHPNLAAEFFLATTLSSSSDFGIDTKLDHGFGLILRPSYKFTDNLEGFARLGYGSYKLSLSDASGSVSGTETSVLYGIGANYYFTDQAYGQLSYTSFFNKDGVSAQGFGLSLGYKF